MLNQKIAYIDLSRGEIKTQSIPQELRRLYLGGRGLDMYLLYNCLKPGTDPLSPDNVLLVSAGLLTGTPAPASARGHVGAKSPLTGCVGSSNIGDFFAPGLRFAGFDHLVIRGKADKPVYLWVKDGNIEIREATFLWGKDTFQTQQMIEERHQDRGIKVLCIGQAGENGVRFANVRTGLKSAAGRTGMGAVMGSKNLKAVAVRGTKAIDLARRREALEYCKKIRAQIMSTKVATALSQDGSMMIWSVTNTSGMVRVKNFQLNSLEDWEDLTVEKFHQKYQVGKTGCFGCTVRCRHRWEIKEGTYAGLSGEGPEYNTQIAFGGMLFNKSWEPVLVGQKLCDKYGLDLCEVANLLAWAMELYERRIIDEDISGGLNLSWDNAAALLPVVIEQIVNRKGLGGILAEGALRAMEKLGEESEYYLMQIKGLSNIASDERPTPSFALGIAVATRGSDHLRSRPAIDLYHLPAKLLEEIYGGPISPDYTSYQGKAREVWWQELLYAVVDSLGLCKFQTIFFSPHMPGFPEYSQLINYLTGTELSPSQLMEIGERIYTLERMFNYREMGMTRRDDYLPRRYYEEATPIGLPIAQGKKIDRKKFDEMLDEYYRLHGWDNNGVPTGETLIRLGLDKEPSPFL